MNSKRNELRAGLFILITVVLSFFIIIWIRGSDVGPAQVRFVSFSLNDNLGGLQVGDDVRLGGFKVGTVQGIHLHDVNGASPQLRVAISMPGHLVLHRDAVIAVETGITGTTDINIENLGNGDVLADHAIVIAGVPDPKTQLFAALGKVSPQLEQTVPKVNGAVDAAKTLLTHADSKLDPIVQQYNKVADKAASAMGQVNDLLGDSKGDIKGTLSHLNEVTGTAKDKLPGLMEQISGVVKKVDTSLTTAQAALLDVKDTAGSAKDTMAGLRAVIVGNRGKLEAIIAGIKTTSDNLKEASIEVRRSPWRLLYKPTPEESGNINIYDSAREFAQGADSLSDAATALRDMVNDPKADPADIQKRIAELNSTFTNFQAVETKLFTAVKP
jgi:ABC-type transporter Mla subunit MlaD